MTAQAVDRPKVTEAQFQRQVLQLAVLTGWRTAHFRPAQNSRGEWRTAVAGDGKGFPDLVLVRETVLFVELKVGRNKLTTDQVEWRDALTHSPALEGCRARCAELELARAELEAARRTNQNDWEEHA